jgi:hypothetical protein
MPQTHCFLTDPPFFAGGCHYQIIWPGSGREENMAEIQDVTEALLRVLPSARGGENEIESIRHATIGLEHLPAILEDPQSM